MGHPQMFDIIQENKFASEKKKEPWRGGERFQGVVLCVRVHSECFCKEGGSPGRP